jgi:protein-tyrosine phosphatase
LALKICFVCLGNIVRSPVAQALFDQKTVQLHISDQYETDSAGTGAWHIGQPPDSRMRRVAARYGLIYDHRARQIEFHDLEAFDLILAMDRDNRSDLLNLAGSPEQREKIHLLREYDPSGGPDAAVPDPYYEGIDGFVEVYQTIERSVDGLLAALSNGQHSQAP